MLDGSENTSSRPVKLVRSVSIIIIEPSNDPRSYRINSEKLKNKYGFIFDKSVDSAIEDLLNAFENQKIKDCFSDKWQNILILKKLESEKKYL